MYPCWRRHRQSVTCGGGEGRQGASSRVIRIATARSGEDGTDLLIATDWSGERTPLQSAVQVRALRARAADSPTDSPNIHSRRYAEVHNYKLQPSVHRGLESHWPSVRFKLCSFCSTAEIVMRLKNRPSLFRNFGSHKLSKGVRRKSERRIKLGIEPLEARQTAGGHHLSTRRRWLRRDTGHGDLLARSQHQLRHRRTH